MSTFTWTAEFGAVKTAKPTVTAIKFGDGYEQRVAHGINTSPKSWNLRFQNRSTDEIDEIMEFLDARGGTESFDWTPPRESDSIRVVCREWSRSVDNPTTDSVSARFDQVYEP